MTLQPPRGTRDLFGAECRIHQHVIDIARGLADMHGFVPVMTPVLESVDVFKRTVGEATDIVAKEMYTLSDRGGETLVLRPEATAAVMRAVLSNGLTQTLPQKLYYFGPMFRYERPQKGRYRQFDQFGVEYIGVAHPYADIEVISLGARILNALGIKTRLEINTLGDEAGRAAYRDALVAYLCAREEQLSEDSRRRLRQNPLRILDSKDEGDRQVLQDAPLLCDYLNDESRTFYAQVKEGLDRLGIPFTENPRLVRGLDYYCHTAFEFKGLSLGAQDAVLAGGRYDGLMRQLGGPQICGVGWAMGADRLALSISPDILPPSREIAILPVGEDMVPAALALAGSLRESLPPVIGGDAVHFHYHPNLGKALKWADRQGIRLAVIVGEDEYREGRVKIKDLTASQETITAISELAAAVPAFPAL